LESMLYGLLLPSGNDAAIALAQHIAGDVTQFVTRMNRQAAQLGMGCTHYTSPSGFYDQGNYSCAADLAVLAHVDLAEPRIARVTHTYSAVIPFPIKGGKLYLYNNNPLLRSGFPGITGMKTGERAIHLSGVDWRNGRSGCWGALSAITWRLPGVVSD
ncbi:MAG: hypothetical protein M3Y09_20015, partial [Actinomycetota bacterium]|nr:hypothetical protein [Actinomycetota bacterium]